MKTISLLLFLLFTSTAIMAQQRVRPDGAGGYIVEDTSGCNALFGAAKGSCIAKQQKIQQQKLEDEQRKAEGQDQQQRQLQQQQLELQRQQIENQRLQNEILRKKLEQEQSNQSRLQTLQTENSVNSEFRSWKLANPWFGTDRAKTEFATLYAKQLQQEHPNLSDRSFLEALTAKVSEAFGPLK